jgi:hypothetical protein
MSTFDPKPADTEPEPDADREREDAPFPSKFGRDGRQRFRRRPKSRATKEPDDADPFADDGGL